MNGADQHKEQVLERLKTVLESSGKSSRAFSKSIGLKPTSFHKVLTSVDGQNKIRKFKLDGQSLFFPSAILD